MNCTFLKTKQQKKKNNRLSRFVIFLICLQGPKSGNGTRRRPASSPECWGSGGQPVIGRMSRHGPGVTVSPSVEAGDAAFMRHDPFRCLSPGESLPAVMTRCRLTNHVRRKC